MTYYIDIDNTICKTEGNDYQHAIPIPKNIAKINKLYDEGHIIIYWSSRGMTSGTSWLLLTINQLREWGVKHHSVHLNKPSFDFIIDDKCLKIEDIDND
jgi:hypothetical protein